MRVEDAAPYWYLVGRLSDQLRAAFQRVFGAGLARVMQKT
jgi:hypothetical protein